MKNILDNEEEIRSFTRIQEELYKLPENATDEEIANFISEIPPKFLSDKDDLMTICKIFAYYSRNFQQTSKQNSIKLFDKILDIMKAKLKNESEFFFNIFGGTYYLHFYMYQNGLIDMEEIIQRSIRFKYPYFTEYFLPEIIESTPEIFDKEIKDHLKFKYSKESIENFKELRSKHFKWLRESNDYNDPLYQEIETNPLRLAIKKDDIESFQKIYSNLNLTVNSKIRESLLENIFVKPEDSTLLEFAIQFNSIKIIKYLIMNGSEAKDAVYHSIWRRNYEIVHMIESLEKEEFEKYCLYYSITVCNFEMVEYSLDNFDDRYPLNKTEFDENDIDDLLSIIGNTFRSSNFIFLEQILIPFLKKNEQFVEDHFYEILAKTIDDHTGYFLKEFLKYPKLEINRSLKPLSDLSILEIALNKRNTKCVEIILQMPGIDLHSNGFSNLNPAVFATIFNCDLKTIDMICSHKNFAIDDPNSLVSSCCAIGNFYALKYTLNHFNDHNFEISFYLMLRSAKKYNYYTLKILLEYYIRQNKELNCDEIIDKFKENISDISSLDSDQYKRIIEIIHEIKP